MAAQLRPGVEVVYFSMDAENPVLLRHLEQGGRGVNGRRCSCVPP